MRVGFFTPRTIRPLHPRLVAFEQFFQSRNIQVDFINTSGYTPTLLSRLNWLCLWFFDLYAVKLCKPSVQQYDIVFVTDMKYLPLVRYAKKLNKIVIYDTIDHNVYLRFYQLEKKIKGIVLFKRPITWLFEKIEKHYAFTYCDKIVVNSKALAAYFKNKAHILYYSSPLETLSARNNPKLPPALLYLGIVSYEKGFSEIVALQQKLNMPMFVYGNADNKTIGEQLNTLPGVVHTPKVSIDSLREIITDLLSKYYLIGFSLIKPAHLSYEIQEANKDIDYLSLGIPIIGNTRTTTREKIDAGCGLFTTDPQLREKLNNETTRETMSLACTKYYNTNYSAALFNKELETIISEATQRAF